MDNKTLISTLVTITSLGFLFVLSLYAALSGRNPGPRLGYSFFVSVLPALGAFVVLKLTKLSVSWKGVVLIYVLLFILVFIQFLVRSSLGNNKGEFSSPWRSAEFAKAHNTLNSSPQKNSMLTRTTH